MSTDTCACGCCKGTEILTPVPTVNRPGLPAISYRVGTHATFLSTMKARLSNLYLEVPEDVLDDQGRRKITRIYPLRDLKTRDPADTAIALLDSGAAVWDVLTFYQERIANEGYLRTATERRSVLELAKLIGYTLRPGVASTVYLAYTLEEDNSVTPPKPTAVRIHRGSRAQSVPGPGELPQSFETVDDLEARSQWNNLQVRLTQAQRKDSILQGKDQTPPQPRLYLKGVGTNLKKNDALLIDFGAGESPLLFRVVEVEPNADQDRTLVKLQPWKSAAASHPLVEVVNQLVERHVMLSRSLTPRVRDMAKESLANLKELSARMASVLDAEKVGFIKAHTVEKLTETLTAARSVPQKKKFADWLSGVVTDFSQAVASVGPAMTAAAAAPGAGVIESGELLKPLLKPASLPPASAARLGRNLENSFTKKGDTTLQLLGTFEPSLSETLPTALANAKVTTDSGIKVYALRVKAPLFGHNVPRQPLPVPHRTATVYTLSDPPTIKNTWKQLFNGDELPLERIALDAVYDQITPGSLVAIDQSPLAANLEGDGVRTGRVVASQPISMEVVGVATKVSVLTLDKPWIDAAESDKAIDSTPVLRGTTVYAQSEELELAEEPIADDVCHGRDILIELDDVYSGLESGRWLIVSGERTDIKNENGVIVPGVKASELVMLASVTQDVKRIEEGDNKIDLPGEKTHTFIGLSTDLAYCYKRSTLKVYGNVVKATHGETRNETLGGGDGSKAFQQFALKQPPLTFVSTPNPAGVESTLEVRINHVRWHETDTLSGLSPGDRKFITQTDDEGKTTIIFGNGQHGARLPTGQQNVEAVYRNGLGKPGNVKAEQITLLVTRPLGVKGVNNPLRASGGANREDRDEARKNAPLAVTALDRLVSTQDYADFARTFAGVGKASATRLADGRRRVVHVTIAGADDIPIEKSSDLYRNLLKALRDFGDPYVPVQLELRKALLLVVQARVRVLPDYLWETVESKIRAALLDKFSFGRRELGQDALLSEVFSTIQAVEGVAFADVDSFDALEEQAIAEALSGGKGPDEFITLKDRVVAELAMNGTDPEKPIRPAELAYLSAAVPDTIILTEVPT